MEIQRNWKLFAFHETELNVFISFIANTLRADKKLLSKWKKKKHYQKCLPWLKCISKVPLRKKLAKKCVTYTTVNNTLVRGQFSDREYECCTSNIASTLRRVVKSVEYQAVVH